MPAGRTAQEFGREWIEAWNAHDLRRVLVHYCEDVVFHSPRIQLVTGREAGRLRGKKELEEYWARALALSPGLRFELDAVLEGGDAITLLYRNHRTQTAAETLLFGDDHKAYLSVVTYSDR